MFYDKQPEFNREQYKRMLIAMGKMSNLFSESNCPYLSYRAHENIFCKYLEAVNLARSDCSADAKKDNIGIGLKTWMGNNDQKVAEFGKLKKFYAELNGIELVKKIAEYRNERIRVTMSLHNINQMIYHVVKRVPGAMQILECSFDYINIDSIKLIKNKGNDNNTYFTDGKHEYHFSVSKNTLYMIFSDLELLDEFQVEIEADPYSALLYMSMSTRDNKVVDTIVNDNVIELVNYANKNKRQICLPLYSMVKGKKTVPEKSGLNQWNARGRKRDENEVYIPYLAEERKKDPDFFPPRNTPFSLHLPNGVSISAKVCQEADKNDPLIGKAIMSNPNKILGKWLLRDVFNIPVGTLVSYEMLEKFGIDSVVFTKNDELDYSVEFAEIGTFEKFYGLEDIEE